MISRKIKSLFSSIVFLIFTVESGLHHLSLLCLPPIIRVSKLVFIGGSLGSHWGDIQDEKISLSLNLHSKKTLDFKMLHKICVSLAYEKSFYSIYLYDDFGVSTRQRPSSQPFGETHLRYLERQGSESHLSRKAR